MAAKDKTRTLAPTPAFVINDDGSMSYRGRRLEVPEVCLEELIGSGANGFVVKGHHRILSVPLAVKFWVSLRTRDSRDKMIQGIAEVKKLIQAGGYCSVVLWRSAGELGGIFYATMDLFHGRTLESWIRDSQPLGLRRLVAYRLVDEVCGMAHGGLYHGDLHARNILVDVRVGSLRRGAEPRLGIIDFGTSLFASRRGSRARHWRVFIETIDRLTWPFEIRRLAQDPWPRSGTATSVRSWCRASLASIRHALIQSGADWLIDPEETHEFHMKEWASRELMLSELFPVAVSVLDLTKQLLRDGTLRLSEESLGSGKLWWPPSSQFDSDMFEGIGPPWSTSLTDRAWW